MYVQERRTDIFTRRPGQSILRPPLTARERRGKLQRHSGAVSHDSCRGGCAGEAEMATECQGNRVTMFNSVLVDTAPTLNLRMDSGGTGEVWAVRATGTALPLSTTSVGKVGSSYAIPDRSSR